MQLTDEQEKTAELFKTDKEYIAMGDHGGELVYGAPSDNNGWDFVYVDEIGWISGECPEVFFGQERDKRKLRKIYNARFKYDAKKKAEEDERIKAEKKERARERRLLKKQLQDSNK